MKRPHRTRALALSATLATLVLPTVAQDIPDGFERQDWLRGSITPERAWWDLQHYDLSVSVDPSTKSIEGTNVVSFVTVAPGDRMQIDLQEPLEIRRVVYRDRELAFEREQSVYWISFDEPFGPEVAASVRIDYGGVPVESENPPWSGGFTWAKDEQGRPFIATSCQGIGASIWWPNKDHAADEPDRGVDLHFTVPETLVAVGNGRLQGTEHDAKARTRTYHWRVVNPINNYGVNVNVGNYVSFGETYEGEFGPLDVEYWVLDYRLADAERQFAEAPRTIEAFEHWFGKYAFYEDSFKLVHVPYLGMEHQSSVTYGNGFANGYRGRDLSATGVGLKFDFIVVHEAAHEWFANNVTAKDQADLWIHESFANYAESLFVEYHFGEEDAATYVIGCRRNIRNDSPIIGTYGVNDEGSGDMYYKGGNMLHTMRHVLNDDERWLATMRALGEHFRHATVTTGEFEAFLSETAGYDFGAIFDQYLRTADVPVLHYSSDGDALRVHFENVVDGFVMPLDVLVNGEPRRIDVSGEVTTVALDGPLESFEVDRDFYVDVARD